MNDNVIYQGLFQQNKKANKEKPANLYLSSERLECLCDWLKLVLEEHDGFLVMSYYNEIRLYTDWKQYKK